MPQDPMLGPDPSNPIPGATGVFRGQISDANFEADFADLAARFSAQTGGGLSPELSAELALEIVLNEVVDQACLATGATGAAIVLRRGEDMICRASSGPTAPQLGVRFDASFGLSAECINTHLTQRCDDALADSRVDIEAARRLGVRSVMVIPLLHGADLVGVFELFSSWPRAFGERDERTLEVLALRILTNLEHASRTSAPPLQVEPPAISEVEPPTPAHEMAPEPVADAAAQRSAGIELDFINWALAAAVLVCAILLGMAVDRHWALQRRAGPPRSAAPASATLATSPVSPMVEAGGSSTRGTDQAQPADVPLKSAANASAGTPILMGGLQVFDNGKEVFRMPAGQRQAVRPAAEQGTGMHPASSAEREVAELFPAAAEGGLLHRVAPEYPEAARLQRVQGAVVLDVHIGRDGAVQGVQIISGAPQLTQVASEAIRQWVFRPRNVNGLPVEMQTRVTLNFRLQR